MFSGSDFDEDEDISGLYENGHWEWDEKTEGLEFIPNPNLHAEESWISPPAAVIGAADFKDDIDLLEQQRFKRIFSRKTCEGDVVKLQDIKDLVLYTAPPAFLTPSVVHLMHLPGTERFLRALILYHQYYLQIADEMSSRMLEMETKIRTPDSDVIEKIYKDNLEDLRLLVAKEYSNFVTASGEFKKFHHMGPSKDGPSLSRKGNIVFESLIRLSIQIVWLALGRKYFSQIGPRLQYMQDALILPEKLLGGRYVTVGILGLPRDRFDTMLKEIPFISGGSSNFSVGGGRLSVARRSKARISRTPTRSSIARKSVVSQMLVEEKLIPDIVFPPRESEAEWFPREFPNEYLVQNSCDLDQRRKWMRRATRLALKRARRARSRRDPKNDTP